MHHIYSSVAALVPQIIGLGEELGAALLATDDRPAGVDLPLVDLELRLRLELLVADRALPWFCKKAWACCIAFASLGFLPRGLSLSVPLLDGVVVVGVVAAAAVLALP